VTIEANMMLMMARTMILPAALRYQTQVAQAVGAAKSVGVDVTSQSNLLGELVGTINKFTAATDSLCHALDHNGHDPYAHAKYTRDAVVPKMADLRTLGDKLEMMVADDLWPIPTYREMLFVK
jgi:glutamine synthetase